MASDRTREQLITQFAKAIQGIISDQTNHDISVGTLEEEVRYNVLPLLDAFERETRLDERVECSQVAATYWTRHSTQKVSPKMERGKP